MHRLPIEVTLPLKFADDHANRECLTGIEIRRTKRGVTFRIEDQATLDDWISDAAYYADAFGFDFEDMRSVCRSARRTLEILRSVSADAQVTGDKRIPR